MEVEIIGAVGSSEYLVSSFDGVEILKTDVKVQTSKEVLRYEHTGLFFWTVNRQNDS